MDNHSSRHHNSNKGSSSRHSDSDGGESDSSSSSDGGVGGSNGGEDGEEIVGCPRSSSKLPFTISSIIG